MDVANDRWDTSKWNDDIRRSWQPKDSFRRFHWICQMFKVTGNAAYELEKTFWQRWNDKVIP